MPSPSFLIIFYLGILFFHACRLFFLFYPPTFLLSTHPSTTSRLREGDSTTCLTGAEIPQAILPDGIIHFIREPSFFLFFWSFLSASRRTPSFIIISSFDLPFHLKFYLPSGWIGRTRNDDIASEDEHTNVMIHPEFVVRWKFSSFLFKIIQEKN